MGAGRENPVSSSRQNFGSSLSDEEGGNQGVPHDENTLQTVRSLLLVLVEEGETRKFRGHNIEFSELSHMSPELARWRKPDEFL